MAFRSASAFAEFLTWLRSLRLSALSLHGYKWLLAGFGCGALYVSPDAIDQIRPRFVGEQSFRGKPTGAIKCTNPDCDYEEKPVPAGVG